MLSLSKVMHVATALHGQFMFQVLVHMAIATLLTAHGRPHAHHDGMDAQNH